MSTIPEHALIGRAQHIPTTPATPVLSLSPLILQIPHRLTPLHLRISVPASGTSLPIILLSHGQGSSNNLSSLHGYGPLVTFYSSHGFAVLQPTHLSSKSVNITPSDLSSSSSSSPLTTPSEAPLFWKSRVQDFKDILDQSTEIEDLFPHAKGRLDWSRVGIVGHSMGGHTASILLGAESHNISTDTTINMYEPRIKAGILLGSPGRDDADGSTQTPLAQKVAPFFTDIRFESMKTNALVVWGGKDEPGYLTNRGMEWHRDPYVLAPGPKSLLSLWEAGHIFGGVSGWDGRETGEEDESVEMVGVVGRMTAAFLRSGLGVEGREGDWEVACGALEGLEGVGMVESK